MNRMSKAFMAIGILGCIGMVITMLYGIKPIHLGGSSTSDPKEVIRSQPINPSEIAVTDRASLKELANIINLAEKEDNERIERNSRIENREDREVSAVAYSTMASISEDGEPWTSTVQEALNNDGIISEKEYKVIWKLWEAANFSYSHPRFIDSAKERIKQAK